MPHSAVSVKLDEFFAELVKNLDKEDTNLTYAYWYEACMVKHDKVVCNAILTQRFELLDAHLASLMNHPTGLFEIDYVLKATYSVRKLIMKYDMLLNFFQKQLSQNVARGLTTHQDRAEILDGLVPEFTTDNTDAKSKGWDVRKKYPELFKKTN